MDTATSRNAMESIVQQPVRQGDVIAVTESPPRDSDIGKRLTGDFGSPRCSSCG